MVDIDELLGTKEEIVYFIKDAVNDEDSDIEYMIHAIELASRALYNIKRD